MSFQIPSSLMNATWQRGTDLGARHWLVESYHDEESFIVRSHLLFKVKSSSRSIPLSFNQINRLTRRIPTPLLLVAFGFLP